MHILTQARKYALANKYEIDINQEAMATGFVNLIGSFFGIFPSSGNFGRTALAADVGAKSQMCNIVVGIVITIVLRHLTSILYYIPKATLGAVICNAVISLVEWPEFIKAFWCAPVYAAIMTSTFLVTAVIDVTIGLEFGILLSVVVLLFQLSHLEKETIGRSEKTGTYRVLKNSESAEEIPGLAIFRLRGYLWFGNATKFRDELYRFLVQARGQDQSLKYIILDCSGISGLDLTTMISLTYIVDEGKKFSILTRFSGCSDQVRRNLFLCNLLSSVGGEEVVGEPLETVVEKVLAELPSSPRNSSRKDFKISTSTSGANLSDVEAQYPSKDSEAVIETQRGAAMI